MDTEKKTGMLKKIGLGRVMMALAILLTAVMMAVTAGAAVKTAGDYRRIMDTDLSGGLNDTIVYSDGFYAMLGFGREIVPGEPEPQKARDEFLADSLSAINDRVSSACVLYSIMAAVLCALFISERRDDSKLKKGLLTAASVLCPFILIVLTYRITMRIQGVPNGITSFSHAAALAAGLICATGGCLIEGLILGKVKRKRLLAVIAVPAVFILFILSASMEGQLLAPAYVESFSYIAETAGLEDAVTYDEEKNVVIFNGKEYPPKSEPNPDHLSGAAAAAAAVLEMLDPWSGTGLPLAEEITDPAFPLWVDLLYAVKGVCLAFLSMFADWKRKKKEKDAISA